ncbi:MAG: hypothetical protein LBJ89_02500 [Holosporales bacterium]|jgi:hypothetical protein|nr:hypothetical protein [Holosporales bacterium]
MQSIHQHCFQTLRLLKTLVEADEMYQPNKHAIWIQIFSTLNQFVRSLFVDEPIDSIKLDEYCHNARLIEYLSAVDDQFKNAEESLETVVQGLTLPNFVPDFSLDYTNPGCEAITFFMNGIAQVVTNINALFPTIFQKFNASSYAVDQDLQNAVLAITPNLSEFVEQFGSKIPLLSDLCTTCTHYNTWETIRGGILTLAEFLQNFANEHLATPLCCRDPILAFLEIGSKLQKLSQVIQNLPITTSDISVDTGNSLVSDLNRGTNVLSRILEQVSEMRRYRTTDDSTCLMQLLLPNVENIDPLLENLLNVALNIHGKLGGDAFVFETTTPNLSGDFCSQLNKVLTSVKSSLNYVATNVGTFNLNYFARHRAFYSDEYFAAFQIFLGTFKNIVQEVSELTKSTINCHTSHSPFFLEELQNIETELASVSGTIKSFCCSSASESFYLITIYLKQLKILLDATSHNYTISFPTPEPAASDLLFQNCEQIYNILQEIIGLKDYLVEDSCNFQKIALRLAGLRPKLDENKSALISLMQSLGITDFLQPVPSDIRFDSNNVASHAAEMAIEYERLTSLLQTLAGQIRQNPPLQASNIGLLSFLGKGKNMLVSLGEMISFLVDRLEVPISIPLCPACSTIIAPHTPTALVAVAIDDILSVVRFPGCCVSPADEVINSANFLRRLRHVLFSLTQLEQIALHSSHEQEFLDSFATLLSRIVTVQQGLASIGENYVPGPDCAHRPLLPQLQELNVRLQDVESSVAALAKTLGANINFLAVGVLEPNRAVSGCEMLAIAIEDCENSMRQCVQYGADICNILRHADRRPHRPQLLHMLDELSTIAGSIHEHLTAVAAVAAKEVSCPNCILSRDRQALSLFVQHFGTFVHLIGDDSDKSIRGILDRYCSSIKNAEAFKVIQQIRNIHLIIQNITGNDSIFSFSENYSIIPVLTELQESYAVLSEGMSKIEKIQCGNSDYLSLQQIAPAVQQLYSKFVNLATFLGCAAEETPLSPPSTFFQAVPLLTELTCQSFSQIAANINQLIHKMNQQQVSFASNPEIVQFLETIINTKLENQIAHMYDVFPCKNCDYFSESIVREFQKVTDALTALKQAFLNQTYLAKFEVIGKEIARQSLEISQMCDVFINNPNVILVVNDALKDQMQIFYDSMDGLKAFLLAVLNNEPLENCLQNLSVDSVSRLHNVVNKFIENVSIEWSATDNLLTLREMTFQEQLATFFSAISKVDKSIAKIFNISKKFHVITYLHDFVKSLQSIERSIESFPAAALRTLEDSAHQFPLFVLSPLYSADLFADLSETLQSLKTNVTGIVSEIQTKCCSHLEASCCRLLHEVKRCTSFLNSIIFNPNYLEMFSSTSEVHELLAHLCSQEGLSGLIAGVQQISSTLTANAMDADECITQTIVPIIESLTQMLNVIAQKCLTFFNDHKLGAALSDIPEIPFYASADETMNKLIFTCTELNTAINYLNEIRLRPNYAFNRQLSEFKRMFESLVELSDAIGALHDLNIQACPRHLQWPRVPIMAIAALFRPAEVKQEDVEKISCCSDFVNGSEIFAYRLAEFESLHDEILSYFEARMNSHSSSSALFSQKQVDFPDFRVNLWAGNASLSNLNAREFSQVLQYFIGYVSELSFHLNEMNATLSLFAKTEDCLAAICFPHMRSANNVMLNLLQFSRDILKIRTVDEFKPSGVTDCTSRRLNLQSILHSFENIFARWEGFRDVWVRNVHTLQYHDTISLQVRNFAEAMLQLRQGVSTWKCANYADGRSVFCLTCNEITEEEFDGVRLSANISPIFEQIANHADDCCPSILHLVVSNVRKNLGDIAVFIRNISEIIQSTTFPESAIAKNIFDALLRGDEGATEKYRNHIFQFVFSNSSFWTNMLTYAKSLVKMILDLEAVPHDGACPSYALNPILAQLDSTVGNMKQNIAHFANCDENDLIFEPATEPDGSLGIADNVASVVASWNLLCGALDKNVPDSVRTFLAKVISDLNEDLSILYDHIPAFKALMDIKFCGGTQIACDITPKVKNSVKKMIFRNARLLSNLWAHNCCDGHARCMYHATKQLEQIKAVLTADSLGSELISQICNCLRGFSQKINEMQFKMNFAADNKQPIHCLFSCVTDDFAQLSAIAEETLISVNFRAQAYPSWDELTAATKNDCGSLQSLYDGLNEKLTMALGLFTEKLANEDPNVILGICSVINGITSSLNGLIQSMQRYEGTYGALCKSCQHSSVMRGVRKVFELFSIANQQLRLKIDHANLRDMQAVHNETAAHLSAYFDTALDDRFWNPIENINLSADQAKGALCALVGH